VVIVTSHTRCWYPTCVKAEPRRFIGHDFRRTHATLLNDMVQTSKGLDACSLTPMTC
jgi:hypothetical protein